jgi:uncharacterized membrane protein YsdA (DUF1294 family)
MITPRVWLLRIPQRRSLDIMLYEGYSSGRHRFRHKASGQVFTVEWEALVLGIKKRLLYPAVVSGGLSAHI